MEQISLGRNSYQFASSLQDNTALRHSFNKLTQSTFGFSLEEWYQSGAWGDQYIPNALIHDDVVVSNVSVNIISFEMGGVKKTGVQLGTVMTAEKYRKLGLNRYLLERVLQEWKDRADFIYLFANDTVLEFYPKFGFERVPEYLYTKPIQTSQNPTLTQLDMEDAQDVAFLEKIIQESVPVSQVSMRENAALPLLHCTGEQKDNVFYLESLQAIVVADFKEETLHLIDVFSKKNLVLEEVLMAIAHERIKTVVLGFTPLDVSGYKCEVLTSVDTFFVLKEQSKLFKANHWRFPALSHA